MKYTIRKPALFVLAVLGFVVSEAEAGCGSGFCVINSNWDVQGPAQSGVHLGLRYEYVKLDQLYAGSDKISAAELVNYPEIETETLNRSLLASLDYTVSSLWSVTLQLPMSDREHSHLLSETNDSESWHFNAVGDVRVLNRVRLADENPWGLSVGVKLPTGSFDKTNAAGDEADRAFQPGSGTTDLLLGLFGHWQALVADHPTTWFVEAQLQQALNERDHYQPGAQLLLDGGLSYGLGTQTNVLLQGNVLIKDHDSGLAAESEDSGGRFLFISPGLAYAVSQSLSVYGFVQQPLYQHVNGVQLTSERSLMAGLRYRL